MDYRNWVKEHKDEIPKEIQRRDTENSNQYFGFLCYLYLGRGRTLRRAYYQYSREKGLIPEDKKFTKDFRLSRNFLQWSSDFDWVKRARALDEYIDAKKLKQTIERQTLVEDNTWSDYMELRNRLEELLSSDNELSARELKEIALSLKYTDEVGRRTAGLPLSIRVKRSDENNNRQQISVSGDDFLDIDQKAARELQEWEDNLLSASDDDDDKEE